MRLNEHELGVLIVGAVVIGILVYIAYDKSEQVPQPRYTGTLPTVGLSVMDRAIDKLDTGDHYFHPAFCIPGQTQIFTPHRYPTISGGNITTLIHQGMDALRRPAPQDNDWIQRPPAEVMF